MRRKRSIAPSAWAQPSSATRAPYAKPSTTSAPRSSTSSSSLVVLVLHILKRLREHRAQPLSTCAIHLIKPTDQSIHRRAQRRIVMHRSRQQFDAIPNVPPIELH